MNRTHTARLGAIAASASLVLAACGGTDGDNGSDDASAVNEPIVATYDGGLWVLDGETLEVAEQIDLEGFNRLNPAGDDDHVLVSTSEGFQVLDAAGGELTETVFAADAPGHVVRHADKAVLFADGSGEITTFDPHDLADGEPETETFSALEAHHGVAIELENGERLITLGDEDERVGAYVTDADGHEVARSEECPGVHGEATAADEVVVIGCEDGILKYHEGEFTKIDAPDDYGRIGNQAGSDASPVVLGDYKTDPDAELERPERISLIDTANDELQLVDLPASYTFRSLARGEDGEALVLGTDGAIHVIDPESGEIENSIDVVDEWTEPIDWQEPRPAIFVREGVAYVSDPEGQAIHSVDLESGEVTASADLDAAPNELSGVLHAH
ncbi:zinc metallochaperone AztD [Aeromicrobium sp. CTD01-1L150]|uniref:zinc metallochaperone AztD n=1 Tax=Aeromicrobium sp. CTD01-1L150 TaxID=3341830 RepID=UPI0035C20DF7